MMTNGAAIGYFLLAAKELGLSEEQTKAIAREMYYQFDFYTEEEAENVYRRSP